MEAITSYKTSDGGMSKALKTGLLLLLFCIAMYEFYKMGLRGIALVCCLPLIGLVVVAAVKKTMLVFWFTFVMNYFIMYFNKMGWLPLPVSGIMEILDLTLIFTAMVLNNQFSFRRVGNLLTFFVGIWVLFCVLEIFNDTCGLGYQIGPWYRGARLMSFQVMYAVIVCALYIDTPEKLNKYIRIWAIVSLISAFYLWKQKHFGFNQTEAEWLFSEGKHTHLVNGILRYWSTFNDAATYGTCMASSAVLFIAIGALAKLKRDKIFYIATGLLCIWQFFGSGTRTAIVVFGAGLVLFLILSKSGKAAIPIGIVGALFFCFLIFTDKGKGNSQIRRMRSAFKKDDASLGVREYNKRQLAKYIDEAPWGIGLGMDYNTIPPTNKYFIASAIPPDSEYVFIWMHAGRVGITVFVILQALILLGGCYIVFFKLHNRALIGIGAGICSAFLTIQISAYINHILMQFPNCFLWYGSMAVCYMLPLMEKDYEALEEKRYQEYLVKKEEKERKKRESRV